MSEMTKEQFEAIVKKFEAWHDCDIDCDHNLDDLVESDAALRAKIEALEKDRDKYQALLLQSCRDNIEDFKVQCKPKCDSYGHEEDCPAAYPGLVCDEMRLELAALRAMVEALEKALQVQGRNATQAANYYAAKLAAMTADRDRLREKGDA